VRVPTPTPVRVPTPTPANVPTPTPVRVPTPTPVRVPTPTPANVPTLTSDNVPPTGGEYVDLIQNSNKTWVELYSQKLTLTQHLGDVNNPQLPTKDPPTQVNQVSGLFCLTFQY
jgi:hypothetical protein